MNEKTEATTRQIQRAMMTALGIDPELHALVPVRGVFPGLKVVHVLTGMPVKFWTEKALRKLQNNNAFLAAYESALAAETSSEGLQRLSALCASPGDGDGDA